MIMSNPKLIEEISAMAKSEGIGSASEVAQSTPEEIPEAKSDTAPAGAVPTYLPPPPPKRRDRAVLLDALRPYVSKERQRAIDTMMTLADVFDAARRRD